MPDPLSSTATEHTTRGYPHEPDEPNQFGGFAMTATAATRVTEAPLGCEPQKPESELDSRDDFAAPSGSRALTARFLAKSSLPPPCETACECVSVGYLRAVAAPPGAPPEATSVGLEDYVALESRPVLDDGDAHGLSQPASTEAPPAGSTDPTTRPRIPAFRAAPGPSYEEVRSGQQVGTGEGLISLASSAPLEVASQVAETTAWGAGVAIAGSVANLWTLDRLYTHAHEEGAELRQATDRDAANLAVVLVGNQALPRSYVDAARHEYRISERAAVQILTAASRNDATYQQLVLATEQDVREGREAARASGIDGRSVLDSKLESDPIFRDRYLSNAGFRHGVRAEVMLAERGYRD